MELQSIQNRIYEIRGYRVMLDFDLAVIYGMETKRLKEQVRRNIKRFAGDDFMLELTRDEVLELSRTQFATLNSRRGGNIKYNPFAFTELGVSMLSSVLNSDTAIEANRNIMRAFVAIRQLVLNSPTIKMAELENRMNELQSYMEDVFSDQNDINQDTRMQLDLINQSLAGLHSLRKKLEVDPNRRRVGYVSNINNEIV